MRWSIGEVAELSRVTPRTLRHYDAIGLLVPAGTAANGYRWYEREQLLRLQQILLLRELGLGLDTIADVLAGQRDPVETLRGHEQRLRDEGQRLGRLADTVSRTIAHLEGGAPMPTEQLFDGFDAEESLAARYGDRVRDHVATARERTKDWTAKDFSAAAQEYDELDARMLALVRAGLAPDDARVLDLVDEHYRLVCRHWTPDRTSYAGLGQLYVDDPRFRARYDALDPALAEFSRDALAAYAEQRL
ncbi:DNA-binding transcriptional MerR regulator [Motilibacter rhizosphaerae]|uniref:DNA-binding transcriptional MerR regulator n=1 Tax=Motilibacter rhizosphaerae TaxID=598652 RepID=A0A4V2F4L3_9ACTN|nr:TipAS antibiotic-recognition domain-containing protein [Motilibacter rhizosphaerae]RZS89719.1 DNA-binding transcriptional MerR regulator [Motilibacter rhizosphaerae]